MKITSFKVNVTRIIRVNFDEKIKDMETIDEE